MDLWGTVTVLIRRWYVTLVAFTLAVGTAYGVYSSVPTTYESDAVIVLTIPSTGGTQPTKSITPTDHTNPLLNFDTGLNMAATIVVNGLETPEVAAQLGVTPKGDPTYTVNNGNANPESLTESPFVFFAGKSTNQQAAHDIVVRAVAKAKEILAERQRDLQAPAGTYITASDVAPPTVAVPQHGSKLRASAVTLALGVVASLAAAFGFESLAQALARRRRRTPSDSTERRASRIPIRWPELTR